MLLAAMLALFAGCATQRIDWQARIGVYTYDQAIMEMGPPADAAKLTDGTQVADWLTQRGQVIYTGSPEYYYPYHHGVIVGGPTMVTAMNTPNYYLRLTFDPAGRLKSWKNFAR